MKNPLDIFKGKKDNIPAGADETEQVKMARNPEKATRKYENEVKRAQHYADRSAKRAEARAEKMALRRLSGKRPRTPLERRRQRIGYIFIAPWLVGLVFLFIYPLGMTVQFAVSDMNTKVSPVQLVFNNFEHFRYAFRGDVNFIQLLTESFLNTVKDIPLILAFAFFCAILLKKKFPGSAVVKTIFFLTVILSSDLFMKMQADTLYLSDAQMQGTRQETMGFIPMLEAADLQGFYMSLGVPYDYVKIVTDAVESIFSLILRSGIQIFIFLAAMHSIPDSLYEASSIEGATTWENFWKITFPMLTPMILVNLVYTVVDSFGAYTNPVMWYISGFTSNGNSRYDYAAALTIIYFGVILAFLGAVFIFIRPKDRTF